jgi:uncharacterized protein YjaG (DUF416 family)
MNFENLSFLQNCKYAYGLSLRLAPFYVQFSNNYDFGSIETYSACMDSLIKDIDNDERLVSISEKYTSLLADLVPDMDDFNSGLLASLGLDAITSILTLLDYIREKQVNFIAEIKELSLNSAEFISESMDEFSNIRPEYKRDPMASEKEFSEALLDLVKKDMEEADYQQSLAKLISEHSY